MCQEEINFQNSDPYFQILISLFYPFIMLVGKLNFVSCNQT